MTKNPTTVRRAPDYLRRPRVIAALYVEARGVYSGLTDVDVWDEARDVLLGMAATVDPTAAP